MVIKAVKRLGKLENNYLRKSNVKFTVHCYWFKRV
uniref:Uncharacterized protein n=1 Tax=Tetranychus urticae TaxID=32264 RepID=T1K4L8_TETUR